jgi:hypothetical protein
MNAKTKYWGDDDGTELYRYGDENFRRDFKWSFPFGNDIEKILKDKLNVKAVREADIKEDRTTATDYIVTTWSGDEIRVACRIRRPVRIGGRNIRDLSIRCNRVIFGKKYETEIDKLNKVKEKSVYLMMWTENDVIVDYSLIDINRMRALELFDKEVLKKKYSKYPTWNKDGETAAVYFSTNMLYGLGCIIDSSVSYSGNGAWTEYAESTTTKWDW